MSIAATATSNYTAASSSANSLRASPLSASALVGAGAAASGGRGALIAEILARILQPSADSANSAPAANSGAAIILTQLLLSTKSVGSANGAVPMELNLNQLLNSPALQKALLQLPPELLARPQVIEALVLKNTLLPAAMGKEPAALPLLILPADGKAAAQNTGTVYRVNIEWQNRLIQLLSPQPLPTGTRVALQFEPPSAGARAAITLLPPAIAAKLLPPAGQPATQTPPTLPPQTPAETIQQSLRELLPRQQALHLVVPLLQKFITPGVREHLPQPIFNALAQLLQSLPKPAQLQTAENVKHALSHSGSFLEANLARAAAAAPGAEPPRTIAATDIKAQINALLALIRQLSPQPAAQKAGTALGVAALATTDAGAEEDFVYAKPAVQNSPGNAAPLNESEPLDTLLTQLSKLLEAGFARIQLNQLDSASARHVHHDTQAPVPTWVLELPLRTPHGVDQLQLRIEQRQQQQVQQTRVQWNVEIAFDLHAAGKFAASLAIVGNSVAATLWAEQEQTHLRVREEMAYLRAGLEAVGVNVTAMQCRLGLPAPRSHPISQQLVDIHT